MGLGASGVYSSVGWSGFLWSGGAIVSRSGGQKRCLTDTMQTLQNFQHGTSKYIFKGPQLAQILY